MINNLPKKIPIFPLSGVIYFPKTKLPLNIFEQRYLDLVKDTYDNNKLMGMVQSKRGSNEIYKVGCLGKISDFLETGYYPGNRDTLVARQPLGVSGRPA